mmetsp:Transcript_47944/g.121711  ORF Transcript_47944/g.121711 Transcript_47944/m.121711 type:complete len:225 (-) Transcript_47944:474-1148(-)
MLSTLKPSWTSFASDALRVGVAKHSISLRRRLLGGGDGVSDAPASMSRNARGGTNSGASARKPDFGGGVSSNRESCTELAVREESARWIPSLAFSLPSKRVSGTDTAGSESCFAEAPPIAFDVSLNLPTPGEDTSEGNKPEGLHPITACCIVGDVNGADAAETVVGEMALPRADETEYTAPPAATPGAASDADAAADAVATPSGNGGAVDNGAAAAGRGTVPKK